MKHIEVVAAIIRDAQGRIFATQRGYGEWKDWWEFPGGKIEAGETPQQALRREIREELAAEIEAGELFQTIDYDYPQFHLTMHCFLCRLKGQGARNKEQGQETIALKVNRQKTAALKEQRPTEDEETKDTNYTLLEHEAARWLAPNELSSVRWLPADKEIIEKLKMMQVTYDILHADAAPQMLVLMLSAEHEREGMAEELRLIRTLSEVPFVLCRAEVSDWDAQLSPWQAPPAFGKENFAGYGAETLQQITSDILPAMQQQYGQLPVCIAGYSLAGLFALWAAVQTDIFQAVAAASPSVWFPGWTDYAEKHPLQAKAVYLSLGDKEDRSRLPLLRTVSDCIRRQDGLLKKQGIEHLLEWNEGNHFRNPELRTAKAIAWCIEKKKLKTILP